MTRRSDIIEILEHGHNLKFIKIVAVSMSIDTRTYDAILTLASDRVRIKLSIARGSTGLDEDIMEKNEDWFCIFELERKRQPDYKLKLAGAWFEKQKQRWKYRFRIYNIP